MTLPNLNDFEDFEFTRMDIGWIIINILAYLILGWERMLYVFVVSILAMGFIICILVCIKMCCLPSSRQAVFAPFEREHYD